MSKSGAEMLRVVVVEDHAVVREALVASLNDLPDMEIVGDAGSVNEARVIITELVPDVAVLDLSLPDGSGRDLVEEFIVSLPSMRTVVHTGTLHEMQAEELFAAGAHAVVLKSLRGTDLVDSIRSIAKTVTVPDHSS